MAFFYLYSDILLILYATALALSFLGFWIEKNRTLRSLFGYLIIFFISFILNSSIISMTELIASFANFYNHTFVGLPTSKMVLFAVTNFCLLKIILLLKKQTVSPFHYFLLAADIVWMVAVTYLPQSSLQVFLFYFPNQLFLFYCGYLARFQPIQKTDISKCARSYLKWLGIIYMVFAFTITLEDFVVIFHIDHYRLLDLKIQNRNFNEDLFSILCASLLIHYFFKRFKTATKEPKDHKQTIDEHQTSIDDFCRSYDLTVRESEILPLLLMHKHNQEIADTLYLSVGTVKTHIHNIYIKLQIKTREELFESYQHYQDSSNDKEKSKKP